MKFRNVWMVLAACVLAAGMLAGCEGETTPSPETSEPAVSGSQPQEEGKAPTLVPGADGEELPAGEVQVPLEESPGEGQLSKAQLADWEEWLNRPAVSQLFRTPFESPDEIDLEILFYDGVGDHSDDLTEEEWSALEAVAGEIQLDVTRVTVDEIVSTFMERMGVELTRRQIARRLESWHYLEEYDAYYHIHGDTAMLKITCTAGEWDWEHGAVTLTCYHHEAEDQLYTVRLVEAKEYYIFDYIRPVEN